MLPLGIPPPGIPPGSGAASLRSSTIVPPFFAGGAAPGAGIGCATT
jgi:hypothetical protein